MAGDSATSLMVDNGRIYQLVTVSVRSPLPVAWIAMGFEFDAKAARELADITGLAVTLSVNSGGRWTDRREHRAGRRACGSIRRRHPAHRNVQAGATPKSSPSCRARWRMRARRSSG